RIQQYLQHEHYDMWEVIEFGDSYIVPANSLTTTTTDTTSGKAGTKSGRTVTLTAEEMQKKKNDVKVRTTLLLSLPNEHQLRFSKFKTARELWAAILKTFSGNEATKKTKKNLLKQQYQNFKEEGSETLEQTFNRLKRVRKSFTPKPVAHIPYRPSQRPVRTNMNGARLNKTSFNKQAHSYENRPFHRTSAMRPPYRALWVPTVNRNFPPVNRKFSPSSRNFPTAIENFPLPVENFLLGA
nr:ribonuclease H-like domain-containing protein [Tanacetum cinerariifolium]